VTPPRIRLVVDAMVVSGLSTLDARRLVDALATELPKQLARQWLASGATAPRAWQRAADAGSVHAAGRIERSAAPMAQAIAKAVLK